MKHKHENNRGANEDSAELGKEGLKPLESARAPELEPIPGREATETDAERAAESFKTNIEICNTDKHGGKGG